MDYYIFARDCVVAKHLNKTYKLGLIAVRHIRQTITITHPRTHLVIDGDEDGEAELVLESDLVAEQRDDLSGRARRVRLDRLDAVVGEAHRK